MPESTAAGIITAIASVLTASALVITAVAVLVPILRRTKRMEVAVAEVHTMVNQERTDAKARNAQLLALLTANDIAVPPDKSLTSLPKADHE